MSTKALVWTGDPLVYRRPSGYGMALQRYLYLFDATGHLESLQPITRSVLLQILRGLYEKPALALAARTIEVDDDKTPLEDLKP
jgi:hypothetical protein